MVRKKHLNSSGFWDDWDDWEELVWKWYLEMLSEDDPDDDDDDSHLEDNDE